MSPYFAVIAYFASKKPKKLSAKDAMLPLRNDSRMNNYNAML